MSASIKDALDRILARIEHAGLAYMLVGSVAAMVHGRVRSTLDVDLVIAADSAALERLLSSLDETKFYVSVDAARQALRTRGRFNVIDFETGLKIDFLIIKARAFSATEFARRQSVELLGHRVTTATLEDTIIAKLEWAKLAGGSARQLEDVAALVSLAGPRLDRAYIEQWLHALGLQAPWPVDRDA